MSSRLCYAITHRLKNTTRSACSVSTGQMVAAQRALGFDYVFDTDVSADLTIMEEGEQPASCSTALPWCALLAVVCSSGGNRPSRGLQSGPSSACCLREQRAQRAPWP